MRGLRPEDYQEPTCIFCKPGEETVAPINLRRCLTRLDDYLARKDYAGAERHLDYWQREANLGRDWRGLLTVENERMGLFRMMGKREHAMASVRAAAELIDRAGLADTVTAATTHLNIGTVYKCFQEPELALRCYQRARTVYEHELSAEDARLGGLYNNMALVCTDLGQFAEARALYERALAIMARQPDGALEQAITELNLANLAEAAQGLLAAENEIEDRLDRARALLDSPALPRNARYAFICEKCAPTFDYYGRFMDAQELKRNAEEIYEGT